MKKVFLDYGHGGTDPGAIGNNLKEKDIVLSIGTKVKKHLERCNIKVYTSRDNDKTVSLQDRCNLANKSGSDCFISLHCNSFSKSSAKGLEVYSSTPNTKDLATILYNQLVKNNLFNAKRGIKHSMFYVLKNTRMRSALIELAFISNIEDAKLLREKQDEFAESISRGICAYLKVSYIEESTQVNPDKRLYAVCVYAITGADNAEKKVQELKKQGFTSAYKIPR